MSNQTTLPGDLELAADQRPVAFELFVPVYGIELRSDATVAELYDEDVDGDTPVASHPSGFRAAGPCVRQKQFALGGRRFALRYAPLPGNAILTERTFPAPLVLAIGVAASVLLGALLWLLARLSALYREVGRLARTDSLTGVASRRAWDEELPRELARAARSGQPVCVALLDLDHFKACNDEHGHQAGDRLLKAATAWEGRLRKTDLLARYGGEEFAILLPDCALDDAMEIAERLRTAQPEGTRSIGVADWDGREDLGHRVGRLTRPVAARGRPRSPRPAPRPAPPGR
jgi:diguanylate cyclase (GGDEF)-like protein